MKQYYCKKCGKKITYDSVKYGSSMCRSCSCKERYKNLVNNPNYRHGDNIKNKKCINCKKIIQVQAIRCRKCQEIRHSKLLTGKNHSQKTKDKMRKSKLGKKNPMYGRKGKLCPMFGKITHGNWGIYKGNNMRSSWEIIYAKWLDKQKIKWVYESITFDLGNTTYTPDFYLPERNKYIEVKGYWREDAKIKFKLFKKLYPKITILIIGKKDIKRINKTLKEK